MAKLTKILGYSGRGKSFTTKIGFEIILIGISLLFLLLCREKIGNVIVVHRVSEFPACRITVQGSCWCTCEITTGSSREKEVDILGCKNEIKFRRTLTYIKGNQVLGNIYDE